MTSAEYAQICERPDVLMRPVIRATGARLGAKHPALAAVLEALLAGASIPKPDRHTGGPDTDAFIINLSDDELGDIVDALGDCEASLAKDDLPAHTLLTHAATLLDRWHAARNYRSQAT